MKTLLILEDKELSKTLMLSLKSLGMSVLHYRDPIKALDNLPELDPDAVLISAVDYPRHWKPIAAAIRATKDRSSCMIVLIKGNYFSFEEAAKAALLEINGVVQSNLQDKAELGRLLALFRRYFHIDEKTHIKPEAIDTAIVDFVFMHPKTCNLIMGQIETLEEDSLTFMPDYPPLVKDLEAMSDIESAYLQVLGETSTISCTLTRNELPLAFKLDLHDQKLKNLIAKAKAQIKT